MAACSTCWSRRGTRSSGFSSQPWRLDVDLETELDFAGRQATQPPVLPIDFNQHDLDVLRQQAEWRQTRHESGIEAALGLYGAAGEEGDLDIGVALAGTGTLDHVGGIM